MKKIIASAIGLAMVGGVTATAFAVENQFGGYWRTRAYFADQMQQDDTNSFIQDSRTRLYYTAKFNDDFKFVNKFEFNTAWGDNNGGDIGADGTKIWKIKNSYVDFTVNNVNTKIGIMGAAVGRGFLFDDDFSGILVTPQFGASSLTLGYMSLSNSDLDDDAKYKDADGGYFLVMTSIKPNDKLSITPYFLYASLDDVYTVDAKTEERKLAMAEISEFFLGADFDLNLDSASLWATIIYDGGEYGDADVNAFLVAAGAEAGVAHGQAFYASGDDDETDGDVNSFLNAPGQSYYWAEIMGYGIFDNEYSKGAPGDAISNIAAFNAGVTLKPSDKLTFTGDVWYAFIPEESDATNNENDLGVEFDGVLTYKIFDNLSADFVLAYLVAGDATGDDDVFEGGVRVSLSF